MKVKGWQIIVIVLGLIVGGGGILYASMGKESVQINHVIHCIDVETGQIYRIDTEKYRMMLPASHPTTGRVCLVRCAKEDNGKWIITGRDRSTLAWLDKDVQTKVEIDSTSGEIQSPIKEPIDYVRSKK